MKSLALFLALLVFAPQPTAVAGHLSDGHDHHLSTSAKCDCPPDCHCHEPGGSCPGKSCTADCDCDRPEMIDGKEIYIHPSMRQAISKTELRMASGPENESEFITVNGVKQFTGFKPDWTLYKGAETINIQVPADWEMKEIDYSVNSYSPVRGQIQGSCWAEGACSAAELSKNRVGGPQSKIVYSSQDIIDCSGFGTARNGGQLSLSYVLSGIALDSLYPYKGYDQKCNKSVEREKPLVNAPFLRGAGGGFPTERELNYAAHTIGSFEVCGCAGALGSGGYQEVARTCGTNHCYAYGGMRWGPNYGKPAGWYHGMKNSWGDGTPGSLNPENRSWGSFPKGWGWYRLANTAGGKLMGSVITELQAADAGPVKPLEPITAVILTSQYKLTVVIPPGVVPQSLAIQAALIRSFKTLEGAK